MSETIDKRLVEMYFDNSQFEKGANQSIKTLQNLRKELDFSSSSSILGSLEKSGALSITDKLGSALTVLEKRFSTLGIAGSAAIQHFVNSGIQSLKQFGKKVKSLLTDPIRDGFQEYELKMNSIQTMLSNTQSKGTTLDQITEALDELNVYADKTIYNFADMTQNIGRFTAAGVDLEDSITSIKGLLNLAAQSGSLPYQASSAMYQLSQALAAGTVRLMDWNSVVNAGMGGELFQNAIMDTARVMGINIDKLIDKYGSFRETLQTGWLTTEVMVNTLKKFTGDLTRDEILALGYSEDQVDKILELGKTATDAATKIKTFTQLISTLKESLGSGWAQSWEVIIGNFEEAQTLWSKVGDALTEIISQRSDARNDLLEAWKDLGGREALIEGVTSAFQGLYSVLVAVGNAVQSVFPPITAEKLNALSNRIKEIGNGIKQAFNFYEYVSGYKSIKTVVTIDNAETLVEAIERGMSGDDVKKLQDRLTQLGYDIGSAGADGIFGKNTQAALKKFQKDVGLTIDGIYGKATHNSLIQALGLGSKEVDTIRYAEETTLHFSDALSKLQDIIAGVSGAIRIAINLFTFVGERILDVAKLFTPILSVAYDGLAAIGRAIADLSNWLDESNIFTEWGTNFQNFIKPIGSAIERFANILRYLLGLGDDTIRASKEYDTFFKVFDSAKAFLEPIVNTIKNLGNSILEFFTVPSQVVDGSEIKITRFAEAIANLKSFLHPVTEWLSGAGNAIVAFFTVEDRIDPSTGEKITGYAQALSKAKTFLSPVISWMSGVKQTIVDFFTVADRDVGGEKVTGFTAVVSNVREILAPVVQWMKDAAHTIYDFFTVADQPVGDTGKSVTKFAKVFETLKKTLQPIISVVKPIIDFLANLVSSIYGVVKGAVTGNGLSDGLQRFHDVAAPIFEWMNGAKDTVVSFFSGLWESISSSSATKSETVLDAVVNLLKTVRDGFLKLWDGFLSFISPGKEGSFGAAVKEQLGKVRDICSNVIETVTKFLSKAVDDVLALSKRVDESGLIGMITAILGVRAAGRAAKGISSIGEALKIFSKATDTTGKGFIKNFKKFSKGLKDVTSEGFDGIKKLFAFTNAKSQPIAKSMLQLSVAIGILSLTLYGVSKMNVEDIKRGGLVLAAMMAALLVFSKMLTSIMKSKASASVASFAWMAIGLSVAVGAMALVIKTLSKMETTQAWSGLARLFAVLALLALFVQSVSGSLSSGVKLKGLLSLSTAIGILALVVSKLSKMSITQMGTGIIGMMFILVAVAQTLKQISSSCQSGFKVSGLIALSVAVGILAGVMALLGKMGTGQALKGAVGLLSVVLILRLLVQALNQGVSGKGSVKYAGLLALSISISILSGIMALLGKMSVWQALKGAAGLLVVTKLLGTLANSISSMTTKATKYSGLIALSIAIGIMSLSLAKIGNMDAWSIAKGLMGLTGVVVLLRAVLKLLQGGDIPKVSSLASYLSIVLMLYAITSVMMKISDMPIDAIAKGLIGMVGVMLALKTVISAASKMSSTSGISAVLASAGVIGALLAFAYVAKQVKDIPTEKLTTLALGISVIFASVGIFTKLASSGGIGGVVTTILSIVGIVAAIGGVIAAFAGLTKKQGFQDFMETGASSIGEIIGSLIGSIEAAKIASMGKGLEKLGNTHPNEEGIKNALACAQLVSDFSSNLPDTSAWSRLSDVLLGSEMSHFSDDMTAFGNGVAALTTSLEGATINSTTISNAVGAASLVSEFANTLQPISIDEAIAEKIAGGSPFSRFCETLPTFAENLLNAGESLSDIPSDIQDKSEAACEAAGEILALSNGLAPYTAADIAYQVFTGETPFESFCNSLNGFATAIKSASEDLALVPEEAVDGAELAVSAANKINELAKNVGSYTITDAILNVVSGGSAFSQFCSSMGPFSWAIRLASLFLTGIPDDLPGKTLIATQSAESIYALYSAIDDNFNFTTNVLSDILGVDSPFMQFCNDIGGFTTAMSDAAEQLSGIEDTDLSESVPAAVDAAKDLAEFIAELEGVDVTTGSGWDKFWGNPTKVEEIFGMLKSLSGTVLTLKTNLSGISDTSIETDADVAIKVLKSLSRFLSWVYGDNLGLAVAYDRQSTFGDIQRDMLLIKETLVELTSVSDAADSSIDYAALEKIQAFIERLNALLVSINEIGEENAGNSISKVSKEILSLASLYSGGGTVLSQLSDGSIDQQTNQSAGEVSESIGGFFNSQYETLSESLSGFNEKCRTSFGDNAIDTSTWFTNIDTESVNGRISGAIKSIGDTMGSEYLNLQNYTTAFNSAGSDLSLSVSAGFSSVGGSGAGDLCEAMLRTISSYEKSFTRSGYNLGLGMRNGIRNSRALVVAAAEAMARAALNKINAVFQVASPSKAMKLTGKMVDIGLAQGILKNSGTVSMAMDSMGGDALDNAQRTFGSISSLLTDQMDGDPVIRPVVDMTNINQGAKDIHSAFYRRNAIPVRMSYTGGMVQSIDSYSNKKGAIGSENGSTYYDSHNQGNVVVNVGQLRTKNEEDVRTLAIEISRYNRKMSFGVGS